MSGVKETRNLLKPSTHLTSASWSDFSKWVKRNHAGWSARRREATPQVGMENERPRNGTTFSTFSTFSTSLSFSPRTRLGW